MSAWVEQLARLRAEGTAAVVVTVALAEGSTPREAGAKMLVTADAVHGSIGGGQLEYRATREARELLAAGTGPRLVHLPLGPSLGQCCGGATTLLLDPVSAADDAWIAPLAGALRDGRAAVLITRLPGAPVGESGEAPPEGAAASARAAKMVVTGAETFGALGGDAVERRAVARARRLLRAPGGGRTGEAVLLDAGAGTDRAACLLEPVRPPDFTVYLFGAGHVGRALVRILSGVPCRITWIDGRAEQFPAELPDNVTAEVSEAPPYDVDDAPPGSYFLVMTHSHQLDLEVSERILRRGDFTYFGLIGSASKRARFEKQLLRRGIPARALERMVCPIGIAGITGKQPAEIAIAVAAQILRVREGRAPEARAPSRRRVPARRTLAPSAD